MGKLIKPSQKDLVKARYNNARVYLLMVLMCSVFNVTFLFMDVDRFYLVSTVIPYMSVIFWELLSGTVFAYGALAVGLVYLLLLVLCWAMSKHKPGWLIAGTVLYALDMIPVFLMYRSTQERVFLVSLVFHVILIGMLVYGILCRRRQDSGAMMQTEPEELPARGTALRRADMEQKHRILLQAEFEGHAVVYRRVKKVNELVIDGFVYDEMELGIEPAHSLSARIDGKLYEVGYDGKSSSYFNVDGTQKAKKTRWY